MQIRRMVCVVLVCLLTGGALAIPAGAEETASNVPDGFTMNQAIPFATNSFSMSIPAKTKSLANSSFSLMTGETVTIKASYAPFDASVDFGLVDSDGVFHYFDITTGSIDKTIKISTSGNYTFQIRNNSDGEVKVSGFVNY